MKSGTAVLAYYRPNTFYFYGYLMYVVSKANAFGFRRHARGTGVVFLGETCFNAGRVPGFFFRDCSLMKCTLTTRGSTRVLT